MTKEEKLEKIKELVSEYNERHKLTIGNTIDAGHVDFYTFNSTEIVEQANADSNEPTTVEEWGLEPDTDYYELEVYKFDEMNEVEVEAIKEKATGDTPDTPWYVERHVKQYLSKDFNYFYKQALKVLEK